MIVHLKMREGADFFRGVTDCRSSFCFRGAMAGKAPKAWALPRFWVSMHYYYKQPVKKSLGYNIGPCLAQIRCGAPVFVSFHI
jgi:hypothetical protein